MSDFVTKLQRRAQIEAHSARLEDLKRKRAALRNQEVLHGFLIGTPGEATSREQIELLERAAKEALERVSSV